MPTSVARFWLEQDAKGLGAEETFFPKFNCLIHEAIPLENAVLNDVAQV